MLRMLSTCTCHYSNLAPKVAIIHAVIDYWTSGDLVPHTSEISRVRDLLAQAVQCLDRETFSGRLESERTARSGRLDVDRRPGPGHTVTVLSAPLPRRPASRRSQRDSACLTSLKKRSDGSSYSSRKSKKKRLEMWSHDFVFGSGALGLQSPGRSLSVQAMHCLSEQVSDT